MQPFLTVQAIGEMFHIMSRKRGETVVIYKDVYYAQMVCDKLNANIDEVRKHKEHTK